MVPLVGHRISLLAVVVHHTEVLDSSRVRAKFLLERGGTYFQIAEILVVVHVAADNELVRNVEADI